MKKGIVIAGPTGVGKTALSIKLAKLLDADIISADSAQVYRGMDIGTAKITFEEMEGVPHYMLDILEPIKNNKFKGQFSDRISDIKYITIGNWQNFTAFPTIIFKERSRHEWIFCSKQHRPAHLLCDLPRFYDQKYTFFCYDQSVKLCRCTGASPRGSETG